MKKLIGIVSMVVLFSSCTDDNTIDAQQNAISAITLESTFVSKATIVAFETLAS